MASRSNIAFEKTAISPPCCLCFFLKELIDYIYLGLSGLNSVPWISVFLVVPHCLDYCALQ